MWILIATKYFTKCDQLKPRLSFKLYITILIYSWYWQRAKWKFLYSLGVNHNNTLRFGAEEWCERRIIFSSDQAALKTLISVHLSVCLSCLSGTLSKLCSPHCIIKKLSGVITVDKSEVHAKGQGQRSKVKFTKVKTQLSCFRTVTPVWIHMW